MHTDENVLILSKKLIFTVFLISTNYSYSQSAPKKINSASGLAVLYTPTNCVSSRIKNIYFSSKMKFSLKYFKCALTKIFNN